MKDHNVISDDFLEIDSSNKYDRIIQNPPFENYQDIDFIYKSYDLLKQDGILVSIVMESRLNPNSTRKIVQQFNNWMQELNSFSIIDIPENSFTKSERSTQTGTKMIIIQK